MCTVLILYWIFLTGIKWFWYHFEIHWVRRDYKAKASREREIKELSQFGGFPLIVQSNAIGIRSKAETKTTADMQHRQKESKNTGWMCTCPYAQILALPGLRFWLLSFFSGRRCRHPRLTRLVRLLPSTGINHNQFHPCHWKNYTTQPALQIGTE